MNIDTVVEILGGIFLVGGGLTGATRFIVKGLLKRENPTLVDTACITACGMGIVMLIYTIPFNHALINPV